MRKLVRILLFIGYLFLGVMVGCSKKGEGLISVSEAVAQKQSVLNLASNTPKSVLYNNYKKNDITMEKKGQTLIIRRLNFPLDAELFQEQLKDVEVLMFDNCDFRYFLEELQEMKFAIKGLFLNNCIIESLDFLQLFPALEIFYAHATGALFPKMNYVIDLSSCSHLIYFYITGMNRNVEFSRIKALPKNLLVFATDAIFDRTNLLQLQKQGNAKLYFDLVGDVSTLRAQGIRVGKFYDNWGHIVERYAPNEHILGLN